MQPYYAGDGVTVWCGDALDVLPMLKAQSFDGIITDLPYGTTACSWDTVIPFEPMWLQVKRLLKPRGAFVTTASQPFTSALVMSNLEWFRYETIYKKRRITGFLNANRRPLSAHENVVIFCDSETVFNPVYRIGENHKRNRDQRHAQNTDVYSAFESIGVVMTNEFYPTSVVEFRADKEVTITLAQRPNKQKRHPTQKPVALYDYLVRTYTNPGDAVLDFVMGSGTTAVACIRTGRRFVGVEISEEYCKLAIERIERELAQPRLFTQATAAPTPTQSALF